VTRDDLLGPPELVAQRLLGALLSSRDVVVRVVDVEAYGGAEDAASHAHRGLTARNASMFGPPGTLYVYLSYGIHHCANVVCGPEGEAAAVLVRGVEVLAGADLVATRRGRTDPRGRLDGPGRVCQGLALTRAHDGLDLLAPTAAVRLGDGSVGALESIVSSPRIGISKERDRRWRFSLREPGEGS